VDVHRHDDGTEPPRTVRGLEVLDAVRHHDRDAVTPPHAEGVEGVGDPSRAVVELGVGTGLVPRTERDLLRPDASLGDHSCVHP